MGEEWKDRDGLEKNIHKFGEEWRKVQGALKPNCIRFFKRPLDTHTYVNLFVEARRASPYLLGHIDAILYPILIGIIIYLINR